MKRHTWSHDELDMLPIHGGGDAVDKIVDPETGVITWTRRQVQYLVSDDDVLFYTDVRTGQRWRIVLDGDGEYWKERF